MDTTDVVAPASVVYSSTVAGMIVSIKEVLVHVKVTSVPEIVDVSVMGQSEVRVSVITSSVFVVYEGPVTVAYSVVGTCVSTTDVVV